MHWFDGNWVYKWPNLLFHANDATFALVFAYCQDKVSQFTVDVIEVKLCDTLLKSFLTHSSLS